MCLGVVKSVRGLFKNTGKNFQSQNFKRWRKISAFQTFGIS